MFELGVFKNTETHVDGNNPRWLEMESVKGQEELILRFNSIVRIIYSHQA